MYNGLLGIGFTGGRILEPSCGTGNFAGAMPGSIRNGVKGLTMVELDNITGGIAGLLYPNADVRIQGFEESKLPDNYFDLAIGNVPFGNYGIFDKAYPKAVTGSIHNYFFAKSLDKVRPGGILCFITSRYTMDAQNSGVRKYIMERADLLGAIRLPDSAFKGNAGTEVVTDILILKSVSPAHHIPEKPFKVCRTDMFRTAIFIYRRMNTLINTLKWYSVQRREAKCTQGIQLHTKHSPEASESR